MPQFSCDTHPWQLHESRFSWNAGGVAESVFALANGYVGTRGTLDEGRRSTSPGTFMSGVFEHHPLSYPEDGYGHPDQGQAIVGVANGTLIRVEINGEPLDINVTPPEEHERTLDLRAGVLRRRTEWVTGAGQRMRLISTRLVSLTHRSISAIHYELEAVDRTAQVVIRSELEVNRTAMQIDNSDPRVSEALRRPFESRYHQDHQTGALLVHRTRSSGIGVAAMVDHEALMPDGGGHLSTSAGEDNVVTTVVADLHPGHRVALVKYLAHVRSADAADDELRSQVLEAMTHARQRGWRGLIDDQLGFLDQFWADADVEVEPDADLQLAIRFNLFQVLQASACLSEAPIGAKGLTGSGYSGHTFWDIEGFVAPTLTLLRPGAAARLLNWRASTLGAARQRAEVLGMKGASFAWRTVDGREVSAYWPASTAAVHLNAGISRAFALHANATGTPLTEIGGVGVLVETARMWASIAHRDDNNQFHFLGVTGPDEYTGVVDDNVLTNLVAQRNLWGAAEACRAYPDETGTLSVTQSEADEWRRIGDSIYVPFDAARKVHPSNEGFTLYREWKFDKDPNAYPIQKHAHYAKVYRRQVVKQADLVLALWWCPEAFTEDQKARAFNYYEQRTVRDSSLSAPVQSVVAARVGHLDLALEYLREAAYTDLCDVQQDTHQGLHLAPLAGSWLALASGFGGLKMDEDQLHLAPRLPEGLRRIAFRVRWRGQCVLVETTHAGTVIRLRDEHGPDQHVTVDGRPMLLTAGRPLRAPLVSSPPATLPPQQPPTREPGLRSREPG